MGRLWQSVENRCMVCNVVVGKMSIRSGKIVVDKYNEHWGCWQKVPGKSEMRVMCCDCQKKATREKFKREKREARERQNS